MLGAFSCSGIRRCLWMGGADFPGWTLCLHIHQTYGAYLSRKAYAARYSKKVANRRGIAKILDHIFGVKDGPTFHEGLVYAKSEIEFDSKLMLLEKWAEFEEHCTKEKQQSFYTWFCKYHSEKVRKTLHYV